MCFEINICVLRKRRTQIGDYFIVWADIAKVYSKKQFCSGAQEKLSIVTGYLIAILSFCKIAVGLPNTYFEVLWDDIAIGTLNINDHDIYFPSDCLLYSNIVLLPAISCSMFTIMPLSTRISTRMSVHLLNVCNPHNIGVQRFGTSKTCFFYFLKSPSAFCTDICPRGFPILPLSYNQYVQESVQLVYSRT